MLKVTWRNLVARKLRLLLSAFAIVLGVAFVAGSLTFTDAIERSFDDIIEGSTADVEIGYEGANDWDSQNDARTIPASVVDELRELPGAESVHPTASVMSVYLLDQDGKLVGGNGPPGLSFNFSDARAVTGRPIMTLVEGELPGPSTGLPQVAIDANTLSKTDYEVGDTVTLVTPGTPPTIEAELVGVVEFGAGSTGGASLTIFDVDYMQKQFFDGKDVYSTVSLNTADGVSQTELAEAAQKVLPDEVIARPGDEMVETNQDAIGEVLGFLNNFLLVFAAVSLVVGTFLIINTFSILVAQRSRELALLRALGASRKQVNRSVLLESVAVGLIGSTLGAGLGFLVALLLSAVAGAFGLDLGDPDFRLLPSTLVASYAVGILVTVVAAYLPARRASRLMPVQALRDDVAMPESSLRIRVIAGTGLVLLGSVGMVAGLTGMVDQELWFIGLGMLAILVGVSALAPMLGVPVIRVFGVLYKPFGTVGLLATENSFRNPRRTAATASALMVGLALMAMMAMLGSSARASVDVAIEESLTSEYVVSNAIGQPFSTDVAEQIRQVDGVETVAALRFGAAGINDEDDQVFLGAVDPADFAQAMEMPMAQGSLQDLAEGKVLVNSSVLADRGLKIGDEVTLLFQGGPVDVEIAGAFEDTGTVPADWLTTQSTLEQGGLLPLDSMLFVTRDEGSDADQVADEIEEVIADLPTVTLKDSQGFAAEQKGQIDTFLGFINALLILSVLIALLGVVNTLALSVIERTREVGLLRAIGMSRRQLRSMIRLEAVVISVLGAILGVGLGVSFGWALLRALQDEGLTETVVPVGTLTLFVVAAAVLGVLAAVFPARRAARLDVLQAITTD